MHCQTYQIIFKSKYFEAHPSIFPTSPTIASLLFFFAPLPALLQKHIFKFNGLNIILSKGLAEKKKIGCAEARSTLGSDKAQSSRNCSA